jgi:hypothetical protein
MREIVLKVLDGSDELIGTTLRLVQKQNSENFICKETGLEIIDKWHELETISKLSGNMHSKMKFDVLLFIDSNKPNPLFIKRVKQTEIKRNTKNIVALTRIWELKHNNLALG